MQGVLKFKCKTQVKGIFLPLFVAVIPLLITLWFSGLRYCIMAGDGPYVELVAFFSG
jgi:hypothetical protein